MDDAYRSTEDPYRNPDDPYRNPDDPYRSMDDPYRKTDDPYCATGERKANGRVAEKLLRLLELVAGETPAVPGFPGLFTHETAAYASAHVSTRHSPPPGGGPAMARAAMYS